MTDYNFKRWIVSWFTKRHERKERRFSNLDNAVKCSKLHSVDIFDCVEHVYF
jgi:hypothetical protein